MSTPIPPGYKLLHLPGPISLVKIRAKEPPGTSQKPVKTMPKHITKAPTSPQPSQEPELSPKPPSNPSAPTNMTYTYSFTLPSTTTKLLTKSHAPWDLGVAIGMLLYYIPPLISTHLSHATDYKSPVPSALFWAPDFVAAVDQYVAFLQATDGCSKKYPTDTRKAKRASRKYMERYAYIVEASYKRHIAASFIGLFNSWTIEQTQMFNKGVDKAVNGVQWRLYPRENVVLEVGEGDWGVWLRGQCEELGMEGARMGESALEGCRWD